MELSKIELQSLKKLIELNEIKYKKLNAYSAQVVDPQIKQIFDKEAQETFDVKQKLINLLSN